MPPTTPFSQRISEFEAEQRERAARKKAKALEMELAAGDQLEMELEAGDQLDTSVVLAPGTKRSSYLAAMEEVDEFEEEPLQKWLEGSEDSSDESWGSGGGARTTRRTTTTTTRRRRRRLMTMSSASCRARTTTTTTTTTTARAARAARAV